MVGVDDTRRYCSCVILKWCNRIHSSGGRDVEHKKGESPGDYIHPPFPNTPNLIDTHET